MASLAAAWAWIKAIFGAGDVAAGAIKDAADDKRASDDLATSAGNVTEADKIAGEAAAPPPATLPPGVSVIQPGRGPATATAGPDEPTPPATPAARRPS